MVVFVEFVLEFLQIAHSCLCEPACVVFVVVVVVFARETANWRNDSSVERSAKGKRRKQRTQKKLLRGASNSISRAGHQIQFLFFVHL
jgi:hypothetical protein